MSTTSFDSLNNDQRCDCGKRVPKNLISFWAQIIAIYVIIVASIINLSLDVSDRELWLDLLSSSLGYVLQNPGPKFKSSKRIDNDKGEHHTEAIT